MPLKFFLIALSSMVILISEKTCQGITLNTIEQSANVNGDLIDPPPGKLYEIKTDDQYITASLDGETVRGTYTIENEVDFSFTSETISCCQNAYANQAFKNVKNANKIYYSADGNYTYLLNNTDTLLILVKS